MTCFGALDAPTCSRMSFEAQEPRGPILCRPGFHMKVARVDELREVFVRGDHEGLGVAAVLFVLGGQGCR